MGHDVGDIAKSDQLLPVRPRPPEELRRAGAGTAAIVAGMNGFSDLRQLGAVARRNDKTARRVRSEVAEMLDALGLWPHLTPADRRKPGRASGPVKRKHRSTVNTPKGKES